jgi:hypothetical protein
MDDRNQATREPDEGRRTGVVSVEEISTALEGGDLLSIAERKAEEAAFRRGHFVRTILTVITLLAVIGSSGFLISQNQYAKNVLHANLWFVLLSGVLGISVGIAEIVSRYRDEPMRALRSAPALTYLGLNALVSVCAYGLLTHYSKTLFPALAKDPLMRSVTAGFGAMAVLRSKFFTLRTEKGEDVGVGPDAAISAFLSTADRGIDRARAKRRLDLVFKSAGKVSRVEYVKDFIKVSLLSFQNLSDSEKEEINKKIDDIYADNSKFPNSDLKLQAICYAVLIIVGEYNFNKLINNLTDVVVSKAQSETDRKDLANKTSEGIVKLVQSRSAEQAQGAGNE